MFAKKYVTPEDNYKKMRATLQAQLNAVNQANKRMEMALERELFRQEMLLLAQQRELLWRDLVQRQLVLEKLMKELWQETPEALQQRLVDEEPLVRWAAVRVIAQRRLLTWRSI